MRTKKICSKVIRKDELTNDYCLISYKKFFENEELSKSPIVKLLCGHCFFFENIKQSYAITNIKGNNYAGKRICPYCLKNGGYLPILDEKPVKDINLIKKKRITTKFNKLCSAKIINGLNAGKRCNCKANSKYSMFKTTKIKTKIGDKYINTIVKKKIYFCGKHKKQIKNNI